MPDNKELTCRECPHWAGRNAHPVLQGLGRYMCPIRRELRWADDRCGDMPPVEETPSPVTPEPVDPRQVEMFEER